jgi:hypothetical protein
MAAGVVMEVITLAAITIAGAGQVGGVVGNTMTLNWLFGLSSGNLTCLQQSLRILMSKNTGPGFGTVF